MECVAGGRQAQPPGRHCALHHQHHRPQLVRAWQSIIISLHPKSPPPLPFPPFPPVSLIRFGVGLTIGSVPPNGQHNCVDGVVFEDSVFEAPIKGIYVKTNPGTEGDGLIANIVYRNIHMTDPLWFVGGWCLSTVLVCVCVWGGVCFDRTRLTPLGQVRHLDRAAAAAPARYQGHRSVYDAGANVAADMLVLNPLPLPQAAASSIRLTPCAQRSRACW